MEQNFAGLKIREDRIRIQIIKSRSDWQIVDNLNNPYSVSISTSLIICDLVI